MGTNKYDVATIELKWEKKQILEFMATISIFSSPDMCGAPHYRNEILIEFKVVLNEVF